MSESLLQQKQLLFHAARICSSSTSSSSSASYFTVLFVVTANKKTCTPRVHLTNRLQYQGRLNVNETGKRRKNPDRLTRVSSFVSSPLSLSLSLPPFSCCVNLCPALFGCPFVPDSVCMYQDSVHVVRVTTTITTTSSS